MNATTHPAQQPVSRYLSRHEALRRSFAESVEHIDHAEPDRIPNGYIQDYIALGWLQRAWDGVRLTPSGEQVLGRLSRSH